MLAGPHDPVNYFTYWVARLHRGGDVLVPDVRDQPLQLLDARDLASFTADLIDRSVAGAFTVTGPASQLNVGTFVETIREHVGPDATVLWVDEAWLLEQDVHPTWERLPYWLPGDAVEGYCRMSTAKARDHGLSVRPLAETVVDVRDWYEESVLGERDEWVDGVPPDRGLAPDEEADLLAAHLAA